MFCVHGIPSGMAESAARELIGRPFLMDHKRVEEIDSTREKIVGPVHIIGVHKNVTERQALTFLGYPDAIIVKGKFGIYVADEVQKIQLVFLANCRDCTATRHNMNGFLLGLKKPVK